MTIEQVKADIASGKSTTIYYSSGGCWWTHLDSDVSEATDFGKAREQQKFVRMMASPILPDWVKAEIKSLYDKVKDSTIPLDVNGAPLFMTKDVSGWVAAAIGKPQHYGRHGLDAFMKSHHQNCERQSGGDWEFYNKMLDDRIK